MYPAPFVIALLLREMLAEPSKETPAIFRAVASFVAVAALPVMLEDIEFGSLASATVPLVN